MLSALTRRLRSARPTSVRTGSPGRFFSQARRASAEANGAAAADREATARRRHALVGPAELWAMKRAFQIAFLKSRGLRPSHRLLDIGCGTLRGGVPLIDYLDAGHYAGCDVRPEALAEGRAELAEAGLAHKSPALVCGEDFAATAAALDAAGAPGRFDYLWAYSVLIHMPDAVLADCLRFAAGRLAAGGAFYANVNLGERENGGWQKFPVVWRSLEFYRDRAAAAGLAVEEIGTVAEHGHVSGNALADAHRLLKFTPAG